MTYVLMTLALTLMITGLIIRLRNRSPYAGAAMDATAIRNHRLGEVLSILGMVCFLVDHFWFR